MWACDKIWRFPETLKVFSAHQCRCQWFAGRAYFSVKELLIISHLSNAGEHLSCYRIFLIPHTRAFPGFRASASCSILVTKITEGTVENVHLQSTQLGPGRVDYSEFKVVLSSIQDSAVTVAVDDMAYVQVMLPIFCCPHRHNPSNISRDSEQLRRRRLIRTETADG